MTGLYYERVLYWRVRQKRSVAGNGYKKALSESVPGDYITKESYVRMLCQSLTRECQRESVTGDGESVLRMGVTGDFLRQNVPGRPRVAAPHQAPLMAVTGESYEGVARESVAKE